MDITGRRIEVFRCYRDPLIGPKPRLAYVPKDMRAEAEIATDSRGPMGIYVKLVDGKEHVVPFANIESFKLEAEEPKLVKEPKKTKE